MANNQEAYFGQFATSCGDPLAAMNTTQAAAVMNRARLIAKDGYWFTGFTLVFMIIEFVVVLIYVIYLCSNHKPTSRKSDYAEPSAPSAPQNAELELEIKENEAKDDET
jgi:heme/copper-type cytochrome/quinol oxidase subunit 2